MDGQRLMADLFISLNTNSRALMPLLQWTTTTGSLCDALQLSTSLSSQCCTSPADSTCLSVVLLCDCLANATYLVLNCPTLYGEKRLPNSVTLSLQLCCYESNCYTSHQVVSHNSCRAALRVSFCPKLPGCCD